MTDSPPDRDLRERIQSHHLAGFPRKRGEELSDKLSDSIRENPEKP